MWSMISGDTRSKFSLKSLLFCLTAIGLYLPLLVIVFMCLCLLLLQQMPTAGLTAWKKQQDSLLGIGLQYPILSYGILIFLFKMWFPLC